MTIWLANLMLRHLTLVRILTLTLYLNQTLNQAPIPGCPASYQQKNENYGHLLKKMTYFLKKSGNVQFFTQNQVKSKKKSSCPQKK